MIVKMMNRFLDTDFPNIFLFSFWNRNKSSRRQDVFFSQKRNNSVICPKMKRVLNIVVKQLKYSLNVPVIETNAIRNNKHLS